MICMCVYLGLVVFVAGDKLHTLGRIRKRSQVMMTE